MDFYSLNFFGIKRQLPIKAVSPKIKVANFSLLGDNQITQKAAEKLAQKLKNLEFDYLVGPEVRVVPLLQELSQKLNLPRYIVCRKNIEGYMINPAVMKLSSPKIKSLVINGPDVDLIKNKKVVIVDDIISSGFTIYNLTRLLEKIPTQIIATVAIFKQGNQYQNQDLIYLHDLPVFTS